MSDHSNKQVREIFFACMERHSPVERAEYIERECGGDGDLQSAVINLIEAHEANVSFLEQPPNNLLEEVERTAVAATLDMPPATEQAGSKIGPYKLLQQIGEGGFGVVYMAEQTQPVRRRVALKIIKPGMDTREVIARFEAERQALALMDHPNIAKVLDAGTTGELRNADCGLRNTQATAATNSDAENPQSAILNPQSPGRPYFVMELVHGVPITEFCDDNKLTTRERLELFVAVCRAVQHAHLKGIIHRDLKPSNVLITISDDKPMPKVIDFGISKALSQQLTEKTLFTAYGQMVGTPLYMSPEQAQFSAQDVDVRSDIYSLGVLLYELLTGRTPFDKETLQKSGFDEMRRLIREVDPPRPSARVSTLHAEALSTVSDQRKIDARKLSQSLRGELDWIVMKALEKDRNRRYESASGLAADVERYLADEPVQACPPSAWYRLAKFARKRKGVLTTTCAVVLALLAGTGVAWWQAVEANAAYASERDARKDADDQRKKAEANFKRANENFKRAERERKQARKNLHFATDAVDGMYDRLAREWIADDVAATKTQREFLLTALKFYRRLVENPQEFNLARDRAAELYGRMARIEGELHHPDEVLTARRKAVALRRESFKENADDTDKRIALVSSLLNLGATFAMQDHPVEALKCYEESSRLVDAARPKKLTRIRYLRMLQALLKQNRAGLLLDQKGRLDEADKLAREAQAEFEALDREIGRFLLRSHNYANYARTFSIRARIARTRKDYAEAARIAEEGLRVIEFQMLEYGDRRDFRTAQGILNAQLALVAASREDYPEAERRLRRQLELVSLNFAAKRDPYTFLADKLYAWDPDLTDKEQPQLWHTWAVINWRLGHALRMQGKWEQAEVALQKARSTMIYLWGHYPNELKYRVTTANVETEIALLIANRWPREARDFFAYAAKRWSLTLQKFPDADEYKSGFHDDVPDLEWFRTTFPDYDFFNPEIAKKLKPRLHIRSAFGSRLHGLTLFRYKKWGFAQHHFQQVVDLRNGGTASDRLHLAFCLAKNSQYRRAREWYAKAVAGMKQHPAEDAELARLKSDVSELIQTLPVEARKPE